MWPHRQQPTRLPHPWDSPGKNTEWVAISFSNAWKWKVKVKSLSRVQLFSTPWTAAYQAPPPMGFMCLFMKARQRTKKYKFLFVKRQKKQNCMFIVIFIRQLSKNTFIWNSERIDRILKKVVPGWETSMVGRSFTTYLSYWTMWMYTQFKILRNNISLLYFGNWRAITSVVKKACSEHWPYKIWLVLL